MSCLDIAKLFSVSNVSIKNRMKKFDIPFRSHSENQLIQTNKPETRERRAVLVEKRYPYDRDKLSQEYIQNQLDNNKSPQMISEDIGCSISTLRNSFDRLGIIYEFVASKEELRVANLLIELGQTIIKNTKEIIPPLELDIFLPEHNLAIEVNGLYWHSELRGKTSDYHLNKFLQCQAKGIRLLQFWDSEINNDWSTAELIIKGYLGSGSVEIEEGTRIIYNDNRFPWDYSELGFTLVEQTEPRCHFISNYESLECEGKGKIIDKVYDCGYSIWIKNRAITDPVIVAMKSE